MNDTGYPHITFEFRLVQRSVSSLDPASSAFPRMDWRFSEFPNCGAHALYVTCVELMTVPEQPAVIGERLLEVVARNLLSSNKMTKFCETGDPAQPLSHSAGEAAGLDQRCRVPPLPPPRELLAGSP